MLNIKIVNERQNTQLTHAGGPLEFGRSESDSRVKRFVIDDPYVSRSQMRIEKISETQIRLENLGSAITWSNSFVPDPATTQVPNEIAAGQSIELTLPVRINAGYTAIQISVTGPAAGYMTLARPVLASDILKTPTSKTLGELGDAPSADTLTEWFERLLVVQRSVAGSDEFYHDTAQAVVDLIGLDRCLILLRPAGQHHWEVAARHARIETQGPEFSRKVIEQVVNEQRTYFQALAQEDRLQSLMGVEAVVASPLFDADGVVIGIVYGCRHVENSQERVGIKPLEAQVVQLLAAAVTAGLNRVNKEAEAARTRVQFEQFFSRELVQELERHPDLLDGRERTVSCLFADVRGFSRISEKLGAKGVYDLIREIMDNLTDQIMKHHGVVIDYYGDGIAAMWNAPTDDAEHVHNACLAARAMQHVMAEMTGERESSLGFPLKIGVGLNTGLAQVGNTGSSRRLKYGPLGPAINLASRVEGVTKKLGVPILVTGNTRDAMPSTIETRRLCQLNVVGIREIVTVYELPTSEPEQRWFELKEHYEQALAHFESREFDQAQAILKGLLTQDTFHQDPTCIFLQNAITEARLNDAPDWQPVIQLSEK